MNHTNSLSFNQNVSLAERERRNQLVAAAAAAAAIVTDMLHGSSSISKRERETDKTDGPSS